MKHSVYLIYSRIKLFYRSQSIDVRGSQCRDVYRIDANAKAPVKPIACYIPLLFIYTFKKNIPIYRQIRDFRRVNIDETIITTN